MYKYFTCYCHQTENSSIIRFEIRRVAVENKEVSYAWLCEDKRLLLDIIPICHRSNILCTYADTTLQRVKVGVDLCELHIPSH